MSDALEKALLSRELEPLENVKERLKEWLKAVEKQAGGIPSEIEEAVGRGVEHRMAEWIEVVVDEADKDASSEDKTSLGDDDQRLSNLANHLGLDS